jgi:hypothetical protein
VYSELKKGGGGRATHMAGTSKPAFFLRSAIVSPIFTRPITNPCGKHGNHTK